MSDNVVTEPFEYANKNAGPGWIVIEPLVSKVDHVSEGGIVLNASQLFDKNPSICERGRVVRCGEYMATGRTGRLGSGSIIKEKDWLKPGDEIQYIPHNPWQLRDTKGGKHLVVIKGEDVVMYPDHKADINEIFDTL